MTQRSGLFLSTATFMTLWLLAGGGVTAGPVFYVYAVTGSWLLAVVIAGGGRSAWRELSPVARLAIAFFCLMPVLQCIPLPPAVWHMLPGRQLTIRTLEAAGIAQDWHPVTLTFETTMQTALISIWLLALLLAVLQLSTADVRALFGVVLALGLIHIAIGMAQVASGGRFLVHDVPNLNFLLGLFANKNHSGLFVACLFLFGYVALYGDKGWDRSRLPLAIGATLLLFATLILTFSRAGLFFGVIALAFCLLLANERRIGRTGRNAALGGLAAIAMLAVLGSTDIAARSLGRFAGVGSDPRWLFWSWSRQLIPAYFPVGSGIGSFPDVFKVLERLDWVKPTYLNHAHNEYLEQLIEAGIGAPILWALVVAMLFLPVRDAWRDRTRTAGRMALMGAAVVILILIHSAFDYPLRRPALAAVFVLALGALLRPRRGQKTIA